MIQGSWTMHTHRPWPESSTTVSLLSRMNLKRVVPLYRVVHPATGRLERPEQNAASRGPRARSSSPPFQAITPRAATPWYRRRRHRHRLETRKEPVALWACLHCTYGGLRGYARNDELFAVDRNGADTAVWIRCARTRTEL
jgi:hypothetical protein